MKREEMLKVHYSQHNSGCISIDLDTADQDDKAGNVDEGRASRTP